MAEVTIAKQGEFYQKIIRVLCFILGAFTLYTSIFGVLTAVIQRGLVLGITLLIAFIQQLIIAVFYGDPADAQSLGQGTDRGQLCSGGQAAAADFPFDQPGQLLIQGLAG